VSSLASCTLFPYTTLFRSRSARTGHPHGAESGRAAGRLWNRGGTPGRCARGLRGCGQDSFAGTAGTPRLLLPRSGTERGHGHGALQPHQSLWLQRTAHGTAERAAGAAGGYQWGRASVGKDTAPASDARVAPVCSAPALRLNLGGAVSSSRCSTTRNPSSSWCSTFPEKALRVCRGGTSTSSSAVPGCSAPALRLDPGRGSVVEPVLDNPKPFIELVLDVPGGGRSEFAWEGRAPARDRKSTRLNSSHVKTSYAVFCLKKKST